VDATYSWHPGTGRVTSTWAVPAPLLPDELFSSWLVRAALAQGCDPLVLTGELWPKWRVWTRDPDRGLRQDRLWRLARESGIEVSAFEAAKVRFITSAVTQKPLDNLATWPWVLALGSRNRKRHGGLQYCPKCLQEDHKPYFRMQWRLAWHTCCRFHRVNLLDRCPDCKATIEPHRLSAMEGSMTICATCMRDLRDAVTSQIEMDALTFQQAADQVVKQRQGQYGIDTITSYQWFELSRYFVRLLRKAALGKSSGLIALIKSLGVDTEALSSPATGLALELLPVQERSMLLVGAWRMLNVGPETLFDAVKAASLTASSLRDLRQPTPLCLKHIIQALPGKSVARSRQVKNNIPAPRSRKAVKRAWVRLQRKWRAVT